jgi:DNA-binding phage protein
MAYGYSLRLIELNREADSSLLGVRLGKVCIRRNIPVSSVAEQLGVSRQTVYNWFVGVNNPQSRLALTVETLLKSIK